MWKIQKSIRAALGSSSGPSKGSTHWQKARLWIEGLLFVAGLALLAVYGAARIESFLGSRNAIRKFEALRTQAIPESQKIEGERLVEEFNYAKPAENIGPAEVDFRLWDGRRVQAYKQSLASRFDAPLGILRISKIHLEVPLLDGTDDLTLNHAVGHIAGTARPGDPGNIGIAGHRDGFFRGLKDVRAGDEIELTTFQGTRTYLVDEIRIVSPSNVEVLRSRPAPSVTLVTCYPFYFIGSAPERYIVTAFLAVETKSGSENSESPSANSQMQIKKEKQ